MLLIVEVIIGLWGMGRMVGQKRKQSQAVDFFRGHAGTGHVWGGNLDRRIVLLLR
jgi:hypothetical protein